MSKRGRPKGYVMSEESRYKISQKLRGRKLSAEHRRKIAIAMIGNQNRVNNNKRTVIDDLLDMYATGYDNEYLGQWINDHKEEILTASGIMSEHKLSSMGFIEIQVDDILNMLADNVTPERILELLPDYIKVVEDNK